MRYVILALAILFSSAVSTQAQAQTQTQISVGIGSHGVSLGFMLSTYPTLVRIPGYPVYYGPRLDMNYFFYDGLYWVYQDDYWYWSTWYNGPWYAISPVYVPLFILRIPVRYYRRPPPYFRGWRADAAPRWGEHWGRDWERQRSGWNRWNRRSVPMAAPLPTYQRNYTGSRYPQQLEQQRSIESRNYRYQPRETVSRQILEQHRQRVESRDRQQYQQRQPQNVQPQQQRDRQTQMIQQQRDRQPQTIQQQQQQRDRQTQIIQQQQQQRVRQPQNVPQPRSQPAQQGRGTDNRGGKGRSDKRKDQKDTNQGGGHR